MKNLLALTRAVHFAACLLATSVCLFDGLIVTRALNDADEAGGGTFRAALRRLFALAISAAGVSGAAWLVLVAMQMSDLPMAEALRSGAIRVVWSSTRFGRIWQIRAVAAALAAIFGAVGLSGRRRPASQIATWAATVLTAALTGLLAWAGHGQTGGGAAHVAADVTHLVVGGAWPGALVPLVLLLRRRFQPAVLAPSLRRFSNTSVVCVLILAISGLVNSWFLVGRPVLLISTDYGKLLLLKMALFAGMVAIGAFNFRMIRREQSTQALRRNALIEIAIGAAVMLVVGIMGLLMPAIDCGCGQ